MTGGAIRLGPCRKPSNAVEQNSHIHEQTPRIEVRPVGEPIVTGGARRSKFLDAIGQLFCGCAEEIGCLGNFLTGMATNSVLKRWLKHFHSRAAGRRVQVNAVTDAWKEENKDRGELFMRPR